VSRLQGKSRWCLSGTPIQNTLDDIGSLFAFIRADPFDKIAVFRHFIARPFDHGRNRKTASRRLSQLIDSTCLRRGRGVLHLPSQDEQVREVEFSSAERAQYQRTKTQMSRLLENQGNSDSRRNTFGQFHVQLQLRILCNHGTFQDPYSWRYRDLQSEREDLYYQRSGQGSKEVKCSLCMQSMPYLSTNQVYRTITGDCAHVLCDECLDLRLEGIPRPSHKTSSQCPICKPFYSGVPTPDSDTAGSRGGRHEHFAPTGQSAKMNELVEDLRFRLQDTKR
jgi:SNF2 family DNA or RNA helicase